MESKIKKIGMFIAMLWISISAFAYDFEVEGIYYNITSMSDLTVEVTYSTDFPHELGNASCHNTTPYSGNLVIPESVNYLNRTFTVTGIGDAAFGYPAYNLGYDGKVYFTYSSRGGTPTSLSSITLPESINYIGRCAFQGCNISNINLPSNLVEIRDAAFARTSLNSVIIPNSVNYIDGSAFRKSNLQMLVLGSNLVTVEDYAFEGCGSLLEVFCTSTVKPEGFSLNSFAGAHSYLEVYVPSVNIYGFGRGYLTFSASSFDYTGRSHIIEWTNNLKAYKCEISEGECQTDVNAGQYTKTLKATYSNGIDFSVQIPYEYTINKAPMTLSVNDVQREYGEFNPSFTCNISGFVNGENEQSLGTTPAFECEATQISKVGNYRILASLNAPNYEITYKYGTLTIIKAPITATVLDSNKVYGNENPDFLLSYSGLKNNETEPEWSIAPKFSTTATAASGVGAYPVTASDGVAANYDVTKYTPGTITVNKRNLTAKANDCERLYGEENPQFGISYIGFVNGDTETTLAKKPVAECSATKASNAGTYPIVVTGGEAENYSFVYQDGSLKINPLTTGFKDVYNSVTYNDMSLSTNDSYFNYIPEIVGPFSEDDFWIELWFLDNDNRYDQHVATISGGDYAGNYVNTNLDRPMWAGKYIFNLTSKGTNPNVVANPSRAYLTVNRTSNNLEWNADSPITVNVGEKVDLGISYQADLWCTFNTDYNEELIEISSEGETGNSPHWFATGLKEGETTLYFGIECRKNDMGFYDFTDSRTLSKRIVVEPSTGINEVVGEHSSLSVVVKEGRIHILNKGSKEVVRVFSTQGLLIIETKDNEICNLATGLYIVTIGNKSFKVKI